MPSTTGKPSGWLFFCLVSLLAHTISKNDGIFIWCLREFKPASLHFFLAPIGYPSVVISYPSCNNLREEYFTSCFQTLILLATILSSNSSLILKQYLKPATSMSFRSSTAPRSCTSILHLDLFPGSRSASSETTYAALWSSLSLRQQNFFLPSSIISSCPLDRLPCTWENIWKNPRQDVFAPRVASPFSPASA